MNHLEQKLQIAPSASNCLAWSEDGLLAIAATEDVHVLIPDYLGWATPMEISPWTHVVLKANQFTTAEWPLLEPLPAKDMSIGEEQGNCHVTAIAWSPPGLARHRRSVLAVLTANHLLSLWAPNSSIAESNTWERVLIVNSADGMRQTPSGGPSHRIRTMAWAPMSLHEPNCYVPFSRWKWGISILAVANDDGSLHFLQIDSPFELDSESAKWRCERICGVDITAKDPMGIYRVSEASVTISLLPSTRPLQSLFEQSISKNSIDSIIFSPWVKYSNESAESIVSFRADGVVSHLRLYRTKEILPSSRSLSDFFQLGNAPELILHPEDKYHRYNGPIVWTYGTIDTLDYLVIGTGLTVEIFKKTRRSGNSRFERIFETMYYSESRLAGIVNGVVCCPAAIETPSATASILSYVTIKDSGVRSIRIEASQTRTPSELPIFRVKSVESTLLQDQTAACLERYRESQGLEGESVTLAGLATHGAMIALCMTIRPKYEVSNSENTATLLWTQGNADALSTPLPWQQSVIPSPQAFTVPKILDSILEDNVYTTLAVDDIGLRILYAMLVNCALSGSFAKNLDEDQSSRIRRLQAVLERFTGELTLELELLNLHPCFGNPIGRAKTTKTIAEMYKSMRNANYATAERFHQKGLKPVLDTCPACDFKEGTALAFYKPWAARCRLGHEFPRCHLTFLPITDPQCQKTCTSCKADFIDEREHPEMQGTLGAQRFSDEAPTDGDERWPFLANYLFEKYDRCPYCDGVFTS